MVPRAKTCAYCRGLLCYGQAMDDGDDYFGERVAQRYDEANADMFEPGVVDAVVEVLAGLEAAPRSRPNAARQPHGGAIAIISRAALERLLYVGSNQRAWTRFQVAS